MRRSFFLLLFISVLLNSCSEEKTTRPETRDLVDAVYAAGTVMPKDYYRLSSGADGNVQSLKISEGDNVKTGEVLMVIDPETSDWRNSAAGEVYRQAQLNASENSPVLRELKTSLQTLELKYKQDSLNEERFRSLQESNAVPTMDYEKFKLTAQASKNDYVAAQERYQRTVRQLQVELKNAESNWLSAGKDVSEHRVKALSEGTVFELYKKQGELVRRGEALALMGSSDEFVLELWVDEEDISLIKPGQEVLVTTDVFKDSVFSARISKIYPSLNTLRQSFKVEAMLENLSKALPAQCNVEANIVLQRIPKALVVPRACILSGDSVLLVHDGNTVKTAVKTGVDQGDFVQIQSGISLEAVLIVPDKKKK